MRKIEEHREECNKFMGDWNGANGFEVCVRLIIMITSLLSICNSQSVLVRVGFNRYLLLLCNICYYG